MDLRGWKFQRRGETLFSGATQSLCNRRLNVKVPEDWVIPSSHFHLKEILVESADDVPITDKCYRDQHADGRRGLYEGKDVKVVALGKASGEVLLFRSDNISSLNSYVQRACSRYGLPKVRHWPSRCRLCRVWKKSDVILQTKKKRDQYDKLQMKISFYLTFQRFEQRFPTRARTYPCGKEACVRVACVHLRTVL